MKVLYAEFTALLDDLTVDVRRDPGNLAFSPYRRSGSANWYIVFEQYADDTADLSSLVEGQGSVLSWLEPC